MATVLVVYTTIDDAGLLPIISDLNVVSNAAATSRELFAIIALIHCPSSSFQIMNELRKNVICPDVI
jgi:hypothetical protein